jgi:hypothetical protein
VPIFLHGGVKVPDELRRKHWTIKRTAPDGEVKLMYPIWDHDSAERALENINSAVPPLSVKEIAAVVGRATLYLQGRAGDDRRPAR